MTISLFAHRQGSAEMNNDLLDSTKKAGMHIFKSTYLLLMMPGSKGQKAVHACMIRLLNLGPAKHEKVAIYVVNQRISTDCRIAGAASQRSNSQASVWVQKSHLLCVTCRNLHLAPQVCNRLSRILIILEHLILRISGTRHVSINALVLAALSV